MQRERDAGDDTGCGDYRGIKWYIEIRKVIILCFPTILAMLAPNFERGHRFMIEISR